MTKYTGHKLTVEDLYSATPSVDSDKARLADDEKKRLEAHSGFNAVPCQTSFKLVSSFLFVFLFRSSQTSALHL